MGWSNQVFNFLRRFWPVRPPVPQPAPPTTDVPQQLEQMLTVINEARLRQGCPALRRQSQLDQAAQQHSGWMAAHNSLTHVGDKGLNSWDRLKAAGYNYSDEGEVIANSNLGPAMTLGMWINDAEHRDILLKPGFRDIGLGLTGAFWCVDVGSF